MITHGVFHYVFYFNSLKLPLFSLIDLSMIINTQLLMSYENNIQTQKTSRVFFTAWFLHIKPPPAHRYHCFYTKLFCFENRILNFLVLCGDLINYMDKILCPFCDKKFQVNLLSVSFVQIYFLTLITHEKPPMHLCINIVYILFAQGSGLLRHFTVIHIYFKLLIHVP